MMRPMPRPSPWNEHCTPDKLWMLTNLVDADPAACWLALDQARGDVHAAAARLITPERLERYATQLGLRGVRSPFLAGPPAAAQLELLAYLEQHDG